MLDPDSVNPVPQLCNDVDTFSFVWTGMTVRCCRTYEEVHEGDIGRVTKLDRDGLHDLNVQVAWGARSAGAAGTYWVRYIHVELLSQPPGAAAGGGGNLSPIKAVLWIRNDDFFRIPDFSDGFGINININI